MTRVGSTTTGRPADHVRDGVHTNADGLPRPLLDDAGAAALLGVKASWIARRAREGKVPHVMLGRWRRYDADALEEWWRGRIVGAGPTPRNGESR